MLYTLLHFMWSTLDSPAEIQDTFTFAWRLNEDSLVRYEITFWRGADFWCFLYHLTKPLPHN